MSMVKENWQVGLRVAAGFVTVFLAVWITQLILGVGPNFILRQLGASENVRVFLGSSLVRLGVLAALIVYSEIGVRRVIGLSLKDIGFRTRAGWWQDLLAGCLIAFFPMAVLFWVEVSQGWLVIEAWAWQAFPPDAFLRNLWLSVLSNLDAGLGEEVLFRGFLLAGLVLAWGKRAGLTIMAVLFAGVHLLVAGASQTNWLLFTLLLTLPGVLLGVAYLRSGSLWLPVGIHFTWDLSYDLFNLTGGAHPGLFGAVAEQQGPAWFVGTAFGIEVGLAGVLVAAFAWAGMWAWTALRRKQAGGFDLVCFDSL